MSCYSAWVDYYSSEAEWSTSEGGFYTTETDLDTLTVTVYSTYKLCDGIPRAIVAGPTITTSTWETTYIQTDEYGDGYDTVEPFLTTIEPTPVRKIRLRALSMEKANVLFAKVQLKWSTDWNSSWF